MRNIHLITVGKIRDHYLKSLEDEYLERLDFFKLTISSVKSRNDNVKLEGKEILEKIQGLSKNSNSYVILLKEKGELMNSSKFSIWTQQLLETRPETIFFVIGGAAGFDTSLDQISKKTISLSSLTFPHQLARILLVEQLYRAQTIIRNHPYHK